MKNKQTDFLLWSAQIDGLQKIFIFGSIHVCSDPINQHLPAVKSVIDKVDVVLNEVDMNMLAGMTNNIFTQPDLPKLDQMLTASQYRKYKKVFHKVTGQNLDLFKNFSPFFVQYLFLKFLITDPYKADTDTQLFEYAVQQGKQTGGLEDFKKHFDYVLKMPYDLHLRQLKNTLGNFSKVRKQFKTLEGYYSQAQCSKIYKSSVKNMGAFKKPLLYNRNLDMFEALIKQAETHSVIGIMGVAHLAGQRGIINLLRQNGATIKGLKTL